MMTLLGVNSITQGATTAADPFWANVVLLALNESGKAHGDTTFLDQSASAHAITVTSGTPSWSTTQSVGSMGASVAFDGADDGLFVSSHANFNPGTGDFTMEAYFYFTNTNLSPVIVHMVTSEPQVAPSIYGGSGDNQIHFYVNGANRIDSNTIVTTLAFYHAAVCREAGTTRLFINGTTQVSTYADSNNYVTSAVRMGLNHNLNNDLNGFLSNVRITRAARYTTSFTIPTVPFPQS